MSHKVSIILPVYNGQKYLSQSIISCINQSHKDIELIIVNDCSTDNSLLIAERFAAEDKRIKIISNKINRNLPASLNIGHNGATGNFLTWTSDDNFFELDAIEIMLGTLLKYDMDIVYSNFNLVDEEGRIKREFCIDKNSNLLLGNKVAASFLYRKEVFLRNDGYDEALQTVEDYDFWLQAFKFSKFHHIPNILYNYRNHPSSLSAAKAKDKVLNHSFFKRMEISYSKFFKFYRLEETEKYSNIFTKLHLYEEIDVAEFMSNYKTFRNSMKTLRDSIPCFDLENLLENIDLRLRANIQKYEKNQNWNTLKLILLNRPSILIKHDRKNSLKIIHKSLKM